MASSRDTTRLRQGLNPLMTTALGSYNSSQQLTTPLSAVSMTSSHYMPASANTPIQPYNPQEWVATPATMPEQRTQPFSAGGQEPGMLYLSLNPFRVESLRRAGSLTYTNFPNRSNIAATSWTVAPSPV